MNIHLHLGFPKAASTFINQTLFLKHPDVSLFSGHRSEDPVVGRVLDGLSRVRCEDQIDFDLDACREQVRSALAESDGRDVVISNGDVVRAGSADRRIMAERMKAIFPESKVLIVIRRQEDMIRSIFNQHLAKSRLNGRHYASINDWMKKPFKYAHPYIGDYHHPIRNLDYWRLLSVYRELFGAGNLLVLPMELLKEDAEGFAVRICDFFGLDSEAGRRAVRMERSRGVSKDSGQLFLDSLRYHNKTVQTLYRLTPDCVKNVVRPLVLQFNRDIDMALSDHWRGHINQICAGGNARIQQEFGLDLEKYGYVTL